MPNIIHKIISKISTYHKNIGNIFFQKKYPLLNSYMRKKALKEGALGVVFMLHRVGEHDKTRLRPNEDLKISPRFLQKVINKYKKAGFTFISIDEVYETIAGKTILDKPFISFTLDDGYLDNYTTAYPIFKRNNVPFCIFLATDFPDKKAILWWYSIEDLILSNNEILLSDGSKYTCITYQQKWDTFRLLRDKILSLDQTHLLDSLKDLFRNYNIDWLGPVQKMAMSWNNIKALSKEPLCTIGAHTVTHPAFIPLSLEEIKEEINEGVEIIKSKTGIIPYHFAYPYGSTKEDGEREYKFLQSFHFKTSFVSYGGITTSNDVNRFTHLPRYMLK